MYYKPPVDENGNQYFVPIVAKNKEFLVGYVKGVDTGKDLITDVLKSINMEIDLGTFDVVLDSTRFNDILLNGKHEADMSDRELNKYFMGIVEELTDKMSSDNSENNVKVENVLSVDCSCDVGYYAWRDYHEIPEETFKCTNCGKVLIHYTGDYDYEYDYEGEE